MKTFLLITTFLFLSAYHCFGQSIQNDQFDQRLKQLLDFSVPVISVEVAHSKMDSLVFLDSREIEEYRVSRIEGARYLGYNYFDIESIDFIDKNQPIVVYCSVGYRSEKIGAKLLKEGYTNVYNLYGSIFEWVNQGYPVVDENGLITSQLHTYNKAWSKWVENTRINKIW